jgi:hypothetical protein
VPDKLSSEQQKAVDALSDVMNGDPRQRLFEQAGRTAAGTGGASQ